MSRPAIHAAGLRAAPSGGRCVEERQQRAAAATPGCPETAPIRSPTWPPCRGYSSSTQAETCSGPGRWAPGRKGSLRACTIRVGTRMLLQIRRAAGAGPVVVGVAKAVQRCGDEVVELVQIASARDRAGVVQTGEALQLGETLGLERAQEVPGVDAVQSASEQVTGGVQIHRGGDGRRAGNDTLRRLACAREPLEQSVAAQRHANRKAQSRRACGHPPQDPVDLLRSRRNDRRAAGDWARRCSRGSGARRRASRAAAGPAAVRARSGCGSSPPVRGTARPAAGRCCRPANRHR